MPLGRMHVTGEDDRRIIGANIAKARLQAGLSQTALAIAMRNAGYGWHQNTVSRVENGRQDPSLDELQSLGEILGGIDPLKGTELADTLRQTEEVVGRAMSGMISSFAPSRPSLRRAVLARLQMELEQAESSLDAAEAAIRQSRRSVQGVLEAVEMMRLEEGIDDGEHPEA